ncbi:MAG TPA: oxygenase MpaB family protein [Pseudomonadales bacterium]|nr:oxygenase MpaB family protein [Pseudomonadales bacterium]
MNAPTTMPTHAAIQTQWSKPLTPKEWDELFPGILDAIPAIGGAANVVMQLARPGVGYGVMESKVDSGNIFKNPLKRARTTFTYLAVAMLGTTEEKLAYRKAVNRSHAQVKSTESSPVQYRAFDPDLQLWVAACLFWGLLDGMTKFRSTPTPETMQKLLHYVEPLATTLQVRPEMWPKTMTEFETYWENELNKVHIDDAVRGFLTAIVDLKFLHPVIRNTLGPLHRFMTAGFLPEKIRNEMQLEWGPKQQRAFDRIILIAAALNRALPRFVRQAPLAAVMWDFRRRYKKQLPLV